VTPEDLPAFTGTTLGEKREGRGDRGEEKRTPGTHNFYIAYFGDKKVLATHRLRHID